MELHRDAIDVEAFALEVGMRDRVVHGGSLSGPIGGPSLVARAPIGPDKELLRNLNLFPISLRSRVNRFRVSGKIRNSFANFVTRLRGAKFAYNQRKSGA